MPAKSRVIIVANADGLDVLGGVQQYLLVHPSIQAFAFVLSIGERRRDIQRLAKMIRRVKPSGILAPLFPAVRRALPRGLTRVNVGLDIFKVAEPTVTFDQMRIGQMAAEHFLAQGLHHLAFASRREGYYSQLRWRGFQRAGLKAGAMCHLFDDAFAGRAGASISDSQLDRWVTQLPKPVGIHLSYSLLAMRVIWACQEVGLHVPRDVAVLGGRDQPHIGAMGEPRLSGFELPQSRLGYEAVKLLDRLLRGGNPPTGPVLVPPAGIIRRGSTDVLAARDIEVADSVRFIRENAHRATSVKELLQHVPLSRRTLERRFEAALGHTPHEEITQAHLERSKELLRDTSLPITQVAAQSGFAAYRSFAETFSKAVGMTPSRYRRCALPQS